MAGGVCGVAAAVVGISEVGLTYGIGAVIAVRCASNAVVEGIGEFWFSTTVAGGDIVLVTLGVA